VERVNNTGEKRKDETMTGLQMMLNSLGIKIDAKEIEKEFHNIKTIIPAFAKDAQETFRRIDQRLAAIEAHLGLMAPAPAALDVQRINGATHG
jgi:hypothetical protein